MSVRILASAVIGAVMTSGAALAADIYVPPVEPLPTPHHVYSPVTAYNWEGFYLGAQGGYAWNSAKTSAGAGYTSSIDGGVLGVYGGYNWQAGSWVFGVDGSINWANASGAVAVAPGYTGHVDWYGNLRGRLGYAFDRFLVYGTAGAAVQNMKLTGCGGTCNNPSSWGWTAGLGAEYAFTDNVIGRLDYAYSDFGSFGYTTPVSFSAKDTSHTLTAGVAFKF